MPVDISMMDIKFIIAHGGEIINMKTNHFKILKETKSKVVKWDIEMSEDLRSSLEREGRKAADKDTNFFVELGLLTALKKALEKPSHFSVDDYWDLPPKK